MLIARCKSYPNYFSTTEIESQLLNINEIELGTQILGEEIDKKMGLGTQKNEEEKIAVGTQNRAE
jgi:hypothetical protein